jgi:RNA polymerase sigma-70 factor (ECF subfamily)
MPADTSYQCHHRAWRQHKGELRAFLAHQCHSTAEADDLLQDVFLKAVQQGQTFCHIDNPRAWLFHVARNLLIDRLRLSKATIELPEDLASEEEVETASVDKLSQCLPRVLSELSAEDRQALVLCDIDGITQQDYARRLGLSLPAAKSRVQRARIRLQALLIKACQVKFDDAGKVCCFTPRTPLTGDSKLDHH